MVAKPSVQSPLRRGLKALAVFGVVLFLFGGSVGFVQAVDPDSQAESTARELVFPNPAIGQRTYHVIEKDGAGVRPYMVMELLGQEPLRHQDGSLRNAFVADVRFGDDAASLNPPEEPSRTLYIDADTLHLTAYAGESESSGDDHTTRFRAVQFVGNPGYPVSQVVLGQSSCLHANIFLRNDGQMSLEGPIGCSIHPAYQAFSNTTGPALAEWTDMDGDDAFHVRIIDDASPTDSVDLWYVSGVPGPVQVAYSVALPDDGGVASATIRLADYTLGDPSRTLGKALIEPAMEPIGADALGHWPDDSDFDVPFRLVDAMEVAMTYPGSDLPAFLEANPEAYAYRFWSFTTEVNGREDRTWLVQFRGTTPDDGLDVWVAQVVVASNATNGLTEAAATYTAWTSEEPVEYFTPDPADRPATFMSFQDAKTWADVFTQGWYADGGDVQLFGGIHCIDADCDRVQTSLTMGEAESEFSTVPATALPIPGMQPVGGWASNQDALWLLDGSPIVATSIAYGPVADEVVDVPEESPAFSTQESRKVTFASLIWAPPAPAATGASLGVAILSGLGYYFGSGIKQFLGFGLFSRLKRPALLEHPSRQLVHDAVRQEPGIRFAALSDRTGMANGTLRHHLHMLVDAGLITRKETNGFTCYFVPRDATPENTAMAGAVQSDGARTVMEFINEHPGATARRIADASGLAVGTVGYHVKKLRDAGLVVSERDGRQVRLSSV